MKISIIKNLAVSPEAEPELADVVTEAERRGHAAEIINLTSFNGIDETIDQMGDVIFYRTSSLTPGLREGFIGRTLFMRLAREKVIINRGLMQWPHLTYKLVQQKLVASHTKLNTIPTWHYRYKKDLLQAVADGVLQYPFVEKPILGAKGTGVRLIETPDDLADTPDETSRFVYQPNIKNDGDFRILMLGGVFHGAIYRRAQSGQFLNNISQGAGAEMVTDRQLLRELHLISGQIGSVFDLTLYGLDLVYNENDGKFYFLEVNAPPQWKGFEAATGVSVSGAFVDLCEDLHARRTTRASKSIRDFYQRHAGTMTEKKRFHWHSRLWLWTGDELSRGKLDDLKEYYLGHNEAERRRKISWLLRSDYHELYESINFQERRRELFKVYPKLINYEQLLLLALFAKTIYNEDVLPLIHEQITPEELLSYRDTLLKQPEHIATLASFAVNYLYLTDTVLGAPQPLQPELFYNIAVADGADDVASIKMQMYMLLHCIIGESRFYAQRVNADKPVYTKMLKHVEQRFYTHYHQISLDLKFEFLVCAALCGYKSKLTSIMLREGEQSLSPIGNFIVDAFIRDRGSLRRVLNSSEHANILYTMARQKPSHVAAATA